jgi:hypothetical protein
MNPLADARIKHGDMPAVGELFEMLRGPQVESEESGD